MEAFLIYIAKSTGLVILFYCAYYFLLRKETFFNSNRWFLIIGLITSAVLPFAVYTKIIWITPAPISNLNLDQIASIPNPQTEKVFEINWFMIAAIVYIIGFLVLMIKLAMDFYSLHSILRGKKIQQQADFKFIDTNENIAPFSYFEYIVYNSSMYTDSELKNIIEHEKVHSDQNHTVDVLVSRFFCLIFWFNPVIWLYKKAITQNLEFIADKEAAEKIADKKAYQYTLLKITTHESCVAITNHFYQSLIKKRIVMLNKNQSKKRSSWKLYVVIPALMAFVLLFQIEVIAKEKKVIRTEMHQGKNTSEEAYKISKTTSDKEIKEIVEKLKKDHNIEAIISDVKRNSDNELTTLKVELKRNTEEAQVFFIKGSEAIKDCQIVIGTESDGSKKIDFLTENEIDEVKVLKKDQKVEVKKIKNSKINCDVKTNSNTHTSISTSTCTNTADVNVNVNTNVNTNAKPIVVSYNSNFSKEPGVIYVSTNENGKVKYETKVVYIDRNASDGAKDKDKNTFKIKTININNDEDASKEKKESVIEIERN